MSNDYYKDRLLDFKQKLNKELHPQGDAPEAPALCDLLAYAGQAAQAEQTLRQHEEGIAQAQADDEFWEGLGQQTVRVLRTVCFEGPAHVVRAQLAQSMPLGHHSRSRVAPPPPGVTYPGQRRPTGPYTMTITQGPIKVVSDD